MHADTDTAAPGDVRPHSLYVTGTDTGIGKSLVACAWLHALRARGHRAVGMKPVASGCVASADGWHNDDALALQAASDPQPAYAEVNPFALVQPLAPELAARAMGREVTLPPLLAAHARLAAQSDAVVVEGVGGWAAPLSATHMQADLVRALDLPVLLVVGLRLGCISHALLSARAISADGLRFAGWVASRVDPMMRAQDDTLAILAARLPAPCCGVLPFLPAADPRTAALHLRPALFQP